VHAQFENHTERILDEKLLHTVKELSKISRNFRDEILSARLVPIEVLITSMQRLVRDTSKKVGKEIELITEGLKTELDKNIINKLENPLMHVIRNCIDHGIEMPEERVKNHKKNKGVIRFIAFYSGASVFIQIQDDGKGINPKVIFNKAVSKGIIRHDDVLTTKQIYELTFLPGFSTATEVTELSGRGVGLDVVKKEITDLHGEINIDSEVGLGTSFTFKLPLTLSIVDALLVQCSTYKILIPTSNILFCKYLPSEYFENKDFQYQLDNKCIPVKRLSKLFVSNSKPTNFEVLVIIVIYEKYFGLLVDRIITSLQAVIKPLGEMHKTQPYFIGASQMGDGSIAYILDTNFLLKN
jgi:two-component system chemotaxis sensor kinase CheA